MRRSIALGSLFIVLLLFVVPAALQGQRLLHAESVVESAATAVERPTNQVIIRFVDETTEANLLAEQNGEALSVLSAAAGVSLTYAHAMSLEAHVLRLPQMMPPAEVEKIAANLAGVEGVLYAEPDRILSWDSSALQQPFVPELVPNDPRWNDMWHLRYTPGSAEGVNLVPAWDITTGSASTVVAVLDTGILAHNDLAGKIVAGYDFIHDPFVGNDGNGRDPNPSDPGDWVLANECGYSHPARPSSWHGLHVAGTIGAATNNNLGIAGVNWHAKILPVRVLGKCGGYTSDIVDGMLWAAGLPVTGVPNNTNPAKVLNLSLGGPGACSATQQAAINQIVAAGSIIVVAAGNENQYVGNVNPANCNNVITVAATNRVGDRAYYSNYGNLVKVSAAGGETHISASNGVLSTLDTGTTTPNNSHTYAYYQGTSMATPHVAGVASLIVGLRPGYTQAQVLAVLQNTARPFPAGSSCNTAICGAGIVDAYRALSSLSGSSGATASWYLRNSNSGGMADIAFAYGHLPAFTGDWNGDGIDTPGWYHPQTNTWYLRNSLSSGLPDIQFTYGSQGDIPVVGDWDGDGRDSIGVFRPSTSSWLLRNSLSSGAADISFAFGNADDVPVVGDWNGNNRDTIGVFRPSTGRWFLRNSLSSGDADITFLFGGSSDIPVTGDWNGNGIDTIGVYRPSDGSWHLRNSLNSGVADISFIYGQRGDRPVVGDWNGNNTDTPGVVRIYSLYLPIIARP